MAAHRLRVDRDSELSSVGLEKGQNTRVGLVSVDGRARIAGSGGDRKEPYVGSDVEDGPHFRQAMPQSIVVANEAGEEVAVGSLILRMVQRDALAGSADLPRHLEPAAAHKEEAEPDSVGKGLRLQTACAGNTADSVDKAIHALSAGYFFWAPEP